VIDLHSLGAHAHLFDADGDDLGFCHLPWPVARGDLAALDGKTFRVVDYVDRLAPDAVIDLLAVVELMDLRIVA
jgi:hypothetical protein